MKKCLSIAVVLLLVLGLLAGCGTNNTGGNNNQNGNNNSNNGGTVTSGENTNSNSDPVDVDFSQTDADMFTDRDSKTEYDASKSVTIKLNGTTATASSNSVKISGSTVTITEEATYVISGTLSDGMIVVNAPETAKLQLVFNGINITKSTSAALYIIEADKVFVTLAEGTENVLANGGTFTAIDDNNIDGAVYSKQDLTFNGTGSLKVTSPAGHGIVCKDDLVFTGGTYTVNSASHGLDANDSIRIANASFEIDAGKDVIHCENTDDTSKGFIYSSSGTINGEAEGDGIHASAYLQIEDGNFDLLVGGGAENGTKASSGNYGGFMGGGFGGMSSGNGSIVISGGNIYVNSSGDGLDANGTLEISGGYTVVVGPTQGDTATLDYDKSGIITGGTFIGTGASGMAQSFSDSEQGVVAVSVGNQSAGTKIVLKDKSGKTIIEYTPELNFAVVILSSPDITKGETYSITVGSRSGEFEAN